MILKTLRALMLASVVAISAVSIGCGDDDSECDECETSEDCDEGQLCLPTEDDGARRCFEEGEDECQPTF